MRPVSQTPTQAADYAALSALYGALLGATAFLLAQDYLAGISPAYWQFWLGAVLVLLVLIARGGLLGGLEVLCQQVRRRAWRPR